MAFGPTGVNESFSLGIGPGDFSEPFAVPSGFTGHVYIHGVGGNQMAVFVVGSDGDGELWGSGGFVERIGQHEMPNVTIKKIGTRVWQITDFPSFGSAGAKIAVALVGVKLSQ